MSSYQVSCFRSLLCPFISDEDPFGRPSLTRLSELSFLTPVVLFFLQTPDTKKEEFRKYLEKSGVIDALTKGMYTSPVSCLGRVS